MLSTASSSSRSSGRHSLPWLLLLLLRGALSAEAGTAPVPLSSKLLARAIAQVYTHPDSSLLLARRAEGLARAAADLPQQGSAWNCIGVVYYTRDEYRPALHAYERALRCYELAGQPALQANVLSNLGSLCLTIDLRESSYRYFRRALALELSLHPDSSSAANSLCGAGVALAAQNHLAAAMRYYGRALHLNRRLHDRANEAQTLSYIGAVYVKQQQYRAAIQTLEAVQRMGAESPDGLTNLEVLQGLGDAYRGLGEWQKAATYYQARIRAEPDMPANLFDSFKRLAYVQHRAGNHAAAYASLARYVSLADTLNDREAARRTHELETRYRTRDLQRQAQVQRLTIARKNQLAIFGFGTAALVLLAAAALAWQIRQKTRANHQLATANDQLAGANAEIRQVVAQKELLMQEVHHRVKNNLQLVNSLLGWQAEVNPALTQPIAESRTRIQSMALIHEHLYRADDISQVRLDEYLGQLLTTLHSAHVSGGQRIDLSMALAPLVVSADEAIPLGLLVNELLTNAYKHAFRGRAAGHLAVTLVAQGPTGFRLRVTDDGVGMPTPVLAAADEAPTSLGMPLIAMMADQLRARLTISPNDPSGTCFEVARA